MPNKTPDLHIHKNLITYLNKLFPDPKTFPIANLSHHELTYFLGKREAYLFIRDLYIQQQAGDPTPNIEIIEEPTPLNEKEEVTQRVMNKYFGDIPLNIPMK